jgi:hypothetical protein
VGEFEESFVIVIEVLKLRRLSREAAAADSCGRQPAESEPQTKTQAAKRRQQIFARIAVAASRLKAFESDPYSRGLTPTAICCRRFAAGFAQLQRA